MTPAVARTSASRVRARSTAGPAPSRGSTPFLGGGGRDGVFGPDAAPAPTHPDLVALHQLQGLYRTWYVVTGQVGGPFHALPMWTILFDLIAPTADELAAEMDANLPGDDKLEQVRRHPSGAFTC